MFLYLDSRYRNRPTDADSACGREMLRGSGFRCSAASPAPGGYCPPVEPADPAEAPKTRHHKIHLHKKPKRYLVAHAEWPNGAVTTTAPGEARLMRGLTLRLNHATKGMTLKQIAEKTGISVPTLSKIQRGEVWPTVATIAHLERALNKPLWGEEHYRRNDPKRFRR